MLWIVAFMVMLNVVDGEIDIEKGNVKSSSTAVPKELLELLRDTERYNKHALPTQDTGHPTVVTISMYIEGISSFQATSMDFALDIYFQQNWMDHRLVHNNSRRILVKDKSIFKLMWHPDVYFANARVSSFHDVTEPNFLVWVYQNGTIYYDCRISLTVMCMQNFAKYPLDSQQCTLRILSYAYDQEQLDLKWKTNLPIERNKEITMPDMVIEEVYPSVGTVPYATGVWATALTVIMHHILQNYVPTALIVIISWFSFWLDIDSVPGRVSLSITTLLTLATQASAARLSLPQVSYIKAIDVWMGTCMGFVFGAMIEFTIVNYWSRRKIHFEPWKNFTTKLHNRFICRCEHRRRSRRQSSKSKPNREMRPFIELDSKDSGRGHSVLQAYDDRSMQHRCDDTFAMLPKYYTAYEIQPEMQMRERGASNGETCRLGRSRSEESSEMPVYRSVAGRIRFDAQPTIINAAGDLSPVQSTQIPTPHLGNVQYADDGHERCASCIKRARRTSRSASPDVARMNNRKVAQLIDQRCRWAFPMAFCLFNAFYWTFYTYWEPASLSGASMPEPVNFTSFQIQV